MLRDLKFSIRLLASQPLLAATALGALALGIGASTAIFSVVHAVLIEELPYTDPDRLYALRSLDASGLPNGLMAPRFAEPLYDGHPLVQAAAIGFGQSGSVGAADGTAYPILPYRVTTRFFDVFTDRMTLGRGFEPNEPASSIVLSYPVWRDHFGSDPDILGAGIVVDNSQRTVIGVAREGFRFPGGADSWQPLYTGPNIGDIVNFEAYLRLRPDVAPERLRAELAVLSEQLGPNAETNAPLTYVLRPLLQEVVGDLGTTVLILSGATLVLLLIACINVASLLYARAQARAHEIGLREAVGARRLRILRQLLTESFVLSAIGGAAGVVLAYSAVNLLLGIGPADLPRLGTVAIDPAVLLFSVGAVFATTLLVGLAPALHLSRTQVRALIDAGGRGGTSGRGEHRVFGALVIAEVGLAVVLVSGAGLLIRSYDNLANTDPGVDSARTLWVRLNVSHIPPDVQVVQEPDGTTRIEGSGYQPVIDFHHALMDRLRGIAGVEQVTGTQVLPLVRNPVEAAPEPFTIVGRPGEEHQVRIRPVATNFFSALGVRILAGRDLAPSDRRGAPGVALVNEAFARSFFPGQSPVGQRLDLTSGDFEMGSRGYGFAERIYREVEIVGVVPDVRFVALSEPALPNLFMSADQFTTRLRVLAVKTTLDRPESLIPVVRREIATMAPAVPVEFGVYADAIDGSIARERLGAALLAVFGAIALTLAAVGIYGVMAYSVTRRTRELALRSALGASAQQVLGLVLRRGAVLAMVGVVLGLAGTIALRRAVEGQLYQISALDPGVLILVPLVLFAVALLASFVPARRAAKTDPAMMLRAE